MTTRLAFVEGNHTYWLADPQRVRRTRVPSVSSLKKTLHQFDNDRWKVGQVAEAARDEWERIAAEPPTRRASAIAEAGLARLAEAREFGQAVHHYCEQLWGGEPVEVPDLYAGHVRAVADWWAGSGVRLVHAETLVWAEEGDFGECAMAGRVDLIVDHPEWGMGVLDLKTWRSQSKGSAYPDEWAFQLAAYAAMEQVVSGGEDEPMPPVSWLGVLHVGPGGADLWRVHDRGWKAANDQVDAARALKALPKPGMEKDA